MSAKDLRFKGLDATEAQHVKLAVESFLMGTAGDSRRMAYII